MSKIKFRVWDRATKKMHVVGEDQHDSLYIHEDCTVSYYNLQNGCGSAGDGDDKSDDGYDLMRFTGLSDKNGHDIYEGDIVKAWIDFGPGGESQKTYAVEITLFGPNLQPWTFEEGKPPEVIGNIHDNPELLEVRND